MELSFIRRLSGVSQHELAKAAGFSRGKMSLAERGYAALAEAEKRAIAKFLKVEVTQIDWPPAPPGSRAEDERGGI
jgi:transcriptional regulator with XRE-family HTH domain